MTIYSVTWYVEVEATDEPDAIRKSRRYLAKQYRQDWEPLTVEVVEP